MILGFCSRYKTKFTKEACQRYQEAYPFACFGCEGIDMEDTVKLNLININVNQNKKSSLVIKKAKFFIDVLEEIRITNNLFKAEMAKRCDVNRSTYGRWLNNKTTRLTDDRLEHLEKEFKINLTEFKSSSKGKKVKLKTQIKKKTVKENCMQEITPKPTDNKSLELCLKILSEIALAIKNITNHLIMSKTEGEQCEH